MKKISVKALLVASILVVVAACGAVEEPEPESGGTEISNDVQFSEDDYKELVTGNNALGFKLLGEVAEDENGNVFISPTSLMMALSMVYNGADGATKEEIAEALQVKGIEAEQLNKANASLISKLHEDKKEIELAIGNSIWLNEEFQFQNDFVQKNKDYFNAEVEEIDVAAPESADKINDWVQDATKGKIEDIVEAPLDANLVSILVNAIYFKGDWTYAFDKEKTETEPFHLADGAVKDVSLMTLHEELAYLETDDFQAVKLPYGEGDMQMTVFLPDEESDLETFKETLTAENWTTWNKQFRPQEGTVLLPKFQLAYEVMLKDTLQKLGLESAFDREKADFSKMIEGENPLWISEVKQKTFIDVHEEGTEASAATSVEIKTTSAPVDEPFQLKVNRPFFIVISDDATESILFMGSISNPLEEA